jgi:hypothetical protein
MNLHRVVRPAVAAINRPITGNLLQSTGVASIARGGVPVPGYTRMNGIELRVQSLGTKELAHMDTLNIQGTLRAVYQYVHAQAVSRSLARGGDLLEFADPEAPAPMGVWLVATVLESWPGWCKVVAQLQKDVAGTIAP